MTTLKAFINGVVGDSTDFQQTLDSFATAVATAHTNLNNALAAEPLLTHKNNLISTEGEDQRPGGIREQLIYQH